MDAATAVGFKLVDKAVVSADHMGTLPPAAIWAFFCLVLMVILWHVLRNHREYDRTWQSIRTTDSAADLKMADAVTKMADELSQLKVIVDERIPRRN